MKTKTEAVYTEDQVYAMQKEASKQEHFMTRSEKHNGKFQVIKVTKYSKSYEILKDNLCYDAAVESLKRFNKF